MQTEDSRTRLRNDIIRLEHLAFCFVELKTVDHGETTAPCFAVELYLFFAINTFVSYLEIAYFFVKILNLIVHYKNRPKCL